MTTHGPILGTTLYSFTNEWQQRLFTLETLVETVAALGLGPAVEVVGFQSFREYPDISDEFAGYFRGLLERHGLFPSCLGGNVDLGQRRDRLMTPDEALDTVRRQILSAQKLGFPVLRIPHYVGPTILEQVASIAEKAEVHVACELHSPQSVDHPDVMRIRELYDRLGSPFLGFIPDFGASMIAIPEGQWNNLRRQGAPEALLEEVKEIWQSDKSVPERFAALAEANARLGIRPELIGSVTTVFTMNAHMPVESWVEVLPYTRHIHGKFYHVDAAGNEPSIPYPDIMALLKRVGYRGTISAEWEGHAFTEEPRGVQEVQAWHAMCSRLLAE